MANKERLIDANTEISYLQALLDKNQRFKDTYLYKTLELVLQHLQDAPTVESVEVVHGRWVLKETCGINTEKYHCSVCDKIPRSLHTEDYCPNCGAKMDGGNEDG